jgi:diguanylate cyclase (GGDEF)-like protein/PAS domain S-box-containing protein
LIKRRLIENQNLKSASINLNELQLIIDALDSSEDGFAIWKTIRSQDETVENFELLLVNDAGAKIAGQAKSELIGKPLTVIAQNGSSKGLDALFKKALLTGHSVKEIVPVKTPQGQPAVFENTVVPYGKDLVFATYRDVSEQQREYKKLLWLSEHDFLTGMPNRTKLEECLTQSAATARKEGIQFGFAFIDIDHFKNVNDMYGHDMGDAVLVNFVKRIHNSLPKSALVARISGDEFAILFDKLDHEKLLTDLMTEVFSAMRRPFRINNKEILITCSAGCVLVDGSVEVDKIMHIADKAMYGAKNAGRNRFLVESIPETI